MLRFSNPNLTALGGRVNLPATLAGLGYTAGGGGAVDSVARAAAAAAQATANTANTAAGTAQTTANAANAAAGTAQATAITALTNTLRLPQYSLVGTTISAVITNPKGIGNGNAWTQNTWVLASVITFKIPPAYVAGDGVFFDGWLLYNFQAGAFLNTYWGVSYITNTYATPTDILGSTTTPADSLYFPSSSQQYIPVNILIPYDAPNPPPAQANLTAGGTITLSVYGYCASGGTNYLSVAPVVAGRVGIALD